MNRKALGKGIRAIIPSQTQESLNEARALPIDEIRPNPYQPRSNVEEDLSELVNSIKEKGVLQPVVVRRRRDGYELVMGERRLRAAKLAGLDRIPAVVRVVEDGEMLELALVENLQRKDLNPVAEALAYKRLNEEFGLSHEAIAQRVGKDRSTITNALRLLSLPFKVREALASGQLSPGHARALLTLASRREQVEMCERIVTQGLSVRETERLCSERKVRPPRLPKEKDVHIRELEEALQALLGTKVSIFPPGRGPGRIVIEFFSPEDLERVTRLIRR
ncbi:MAG: ParB/RepB/Spo0J family partition protein [candidate division WOR-3 bacterium]